MRSRERPTKRLGESVKQRRAAADRFGIEAYDAAGVGLVAAFAGWTVVSAAVRGGNPIPQLVLLVTATAAYALGRLQGRDHAVRVATVIVLVILTMTLASGPGAFAGGPLDPPLGYGNANGALYALGVAAAAVIARASNRASIRWVGAILAVLLLMFTVLTTSKAATVLAGGIVMVALGAHRLGRGVLLVAPALVFAAVAATVVVGVTRGFLEPPGVEAVLTERRADLWHEALEITAQAPAFGAGPGGFADTSPTALSDPDARWAHSAYLQTAAETGIPGTLLLGAVTLWSFGALFRSQQDLRLVVIGAAAASAFALHAAIDYLVHFPALVVLMALLVGMASSRSLLTPDAHDAKDCAP
jgi:O-antigen ligase